MDGHPTTALWSEGEEGLAVSWACPASAKSYVVRLRPGHEEDWRRFAASARCH